jgi:hypothetical protein
MWSARTPPPQVVVGDRPAPTGLIVSAAALEIAVHGWDVGQATGDARDLPEDLARALLPVAREVVAPDDRPARFAAPLLPLPGASRSDSLLAFLGRG